MADIAKIKDNIQSMINQGASESEIDIYVSSEGVSLDQLQKTEQKKPETIKEQIKEKITKETQDQAKPQLEGQPSSDDLMKKYQEQGAGALTSEEADRLLMEKNIDVLSTPENQAKLAQRQAEYGKQFGGINIEDTEGKGFLDKIGTAASNVGQLLTSGAGREALLSGGVQGAKESARALAQGATFGFGEELESLATGQDVEKIRTEMEIAKHNNPFAMNALEIGGSLATGIGTSGLGIRAAAKLGFLKAPQVANVAAQQVAGEVAKEGAKKFGKEFLKKVAIGAGTGLTQGALSGFGTGEGGLSNRLENAAYAGAIGAGFGAPLAGLGAAGGKLLTATKDMIAPTLGQTLGQGAIGQSVRGLENLLKQSLIAGQPLRGAAQKQIKGTMEFIEGMTPKASQTLEDMGGRVTKAAETALDKIRNTQNKLYEKGVYSNIEGGRYAPAVTDNIKTVISDLGKESPVAGDMVKRIWSKYDKPDLNITQLNDFKQQVGSILNKEGVKLPQTVKAQLYNAAKKDFYNSVERAAPENVKKDVMKSLARGDKYYSKVEKTGTGDFLRQFEDADEFQKAALANKVLRTAQEGKRESYSTLNTLLKRSAPEDADLIKQNIVRHTLIPYGKEAYEITAKQVASKFNDIPDNTKKLLFKEALPAIEKRMDQFRKLGDRPLNTSGTAAAVGDLSVLMGAGASGMLGSSAEGKLKTAGAAAGTGITIAALLANPKMAARTLQAIGKSRAIIPTMTMGIGKANTESQKQQESK